MFRNEEINVFEKRSKANIHYTLDGLISEGGGGGGAYIQNDIFVSE